MHCNELRYGKWLSTDIDYDICLDCFAFFGGVLVIPPFPLPVIVYQWTLDWYLISVYYVVSSQQGTVPCINKII